MNDLLVPRARDRARLEGDEIAAVLEVLSLDRLPPVLGHRVDCDDDVAHSAAMQRGRESLQSRGLIDPAGGVDPELRDWMWALVRPVWQVSARVAVGGNIVDRFCISSGPAGATVVGRALPAATNPTGDGAPPDIEIRRVAAGAGDVTLGVLGRAGGLTVGLPGHPADMVADLLGKRATPERTAALLQRWDVDERRARLLASALASEQRYVEIVVERRQHEVPVRVAEPIAIIDTDRGRILVLTSRAADGERWVSLVPGSARRLIEEIDAAVRIASRPEAAEREASLPGLV